MNLKIIFKASHLLCFSFMLISLSSILSGCKNGSKQNNTLNLEPIYSFSVLSTEELTSLKELSQQMEGSFMTTHIEDSLGDLVCSKKDCYFYICIRFLNDESLNQKLERSAIPLLLQVSQHPDHPEAESILLLHPESNKHFYYEERQLFQLPDQNLSYNNREYRVWDVQFNRFNKIEKILLAEQSLSLEDYQTQMKNEQDQAVSLPLLLSSSFSKRHSSPCTSWPILNFNHKKSTPPSYLQENSKNSFSLSPNARDQTIREVLKGKRLPLKVKTE